MASLQQSLLDAEHAKVDLDAEGSRRKMTLLALMTLGSTLLLAANLLSEKPARAEEPPETPAETAAAERLIELAIQQSGALEARKGPGAATKPDD